MFVAAPLEKSLAELSTEELAGEITTLYSRISAETCRWLQLVAEYDRRNAFRDVWGARHMADWLSWHCGVGIRAAHEQIRVARRLAELPLTTEAFARGELSYSKVRAISRVADEHTEASLLRLARDTTAAQMERIASSYRRARTVSKEDECSRERYATWDWDEDGSLSLRARFSPEEGAVIKKALEIAQEEIRRERDDDCHDATEGRKGAGPELRVTNADAVVRLAESMLAGARGTASGGDATQVVIHVDLDALDDEPGSDCRCEIEGAGISTGTARRLSCDASVVTMIERGGEPLSVGRKTRSVPPAVRRAMRSRDGGCRFPGCTADRFIDGHHIKHWIDGGETSLRNLVSLCRHHHRLLHEGGFSVEAKARGEFSFIRRDGTRLPAAQPLPGWMPPSGRRELPVPDCADPKGRQGLRPLGGCGPHSGRQPLNLELTVWALGANRELKLKRLSAPERELSVEREVASVRRE